MNDGCRKCQLDKKLNAYPDGATGEQIREYQRMVTDIVTNSGDASSPEIASRISAVYRGLFGPEKDFTGIKAHFNALMMELLPDMRENVRRAEDPLKRAVQLAMTGNFIDFVALANVDEKKLRQLLADAHLNKVDQDMLEAFRQEIITARKLVYFTDNCGEIVTDRLLMETIQAIHPSLQMTAVVRGKPVANDATLEDAEQIGLGETARKIIGSGSDIPGIVPEHLSGEALEAIREADLLVSKGQGNYESLSGCGWNIFYIFMCKCSFFTQRFGVKQFTGILTREGKPAGTGQE